MGGNSVFRHSRLLASLFLLAIPLLVFHRALLRGEIFVPADLLLYVAPWAHTSHAPTTAWNVLRFDGITQFYPWRVQAARAIHAGRLPLWNPYVFAASGGAPFLADSQSAPLYPANALFYLFPLSRIGYAFGLTAAIHLYIAAKGMYRLLRRGLGLRRVCALLGAATFSLSAPIVTWLALPTFLAVACYMPWLLLYIRAVLAPAHPIDARRRRNALWGTGIVIGLMLLAGHLQIAFYGLLLAASYAVFLAATARAGAFGFLSRLLTLLGAGAFGVALALPQMLPTIELSRVSHRAVPGPPDAVGYANYVANALPVRNLVTVLLPNFFGHPNPIGTPYWNTNNYAEWALYVGIIPLLLAFYAVGLPYRRNAAAIVPAQPAAPPDRVFFAGAGLLALLLAMGTFLDAPFFYLVPGYSQTGNPARILIVFALCAAALAAIGLEALLRPDLSRALKERAALVAIGAPALIAAWGASAATRWARAQFPTVPLSTLLHPILPSVYLGCGLFLIAAGAIVLFTRPSPHTRIAGTGFLLLTIIDLWAWGGNYNPSSPPDRVYPATPGIIFLQNNARADDRIAPINRAWSLGKTGPQGAVLPPDALTVFGLHDVAGYDSLFPRAAKERIVAAGGGEDPAPQENGNMAFVKSAEAAMALGARWIVFAPDRVPLRLPEGLRTAYAGDDLWIAENTRSAQPFDPHAERRYQPASFRLGLFTALCALGALAGGVGRVGRMTRYRAKPGPRA